MTQYTIQRLSSRDGDKTAPASLTQSVNIDWTMISALSINIFPWYKSGLKQETQVKLCYDNDHIFLLFIAQDRYCTAKQTQLNHMKICEDSCVEFFFSPSGILGSSYVNLEVNCFGTMHIAYGDNRNERKYITAELANQIGCKTSITPDKKTEKCKQSYWTIEIKLPFSVIEQLTNKPVCKDKWFANFYRCGGIIESQFSTWKQIDTAHPDYHQPNSFGKLIFDQ